MHFDRQASQAVSCPIFSSPWIVAELTASLHHFAFNLYNRSMQCNDELWFIFRMVATMKYASFTAYPLTRSSMMCPNSQGANTQAQAAIFSCLAIPTCTNWTLAAPLVRSCKTGIVQSIPPWHKSNRTEHPQNALAPNNAVTLDAKEALYKQLREQFMLKQQKGKLLIVHYEETLHNNNWMKDHSTMHNAHAWCMSDASMSHNLM